MALTKRKETKQIDQSVQSRLMGTIDGRNIVVVGQAIEQLAGKRICAGGIGHGCNRRDPHAFAARLTYDDYSRGLKNILLTAAQADAAYFCRHCQKFQGCHQCVGDPASLVCNGCKDWANDISEAVHGRMVPRERARDAFKLVGMLAAGKITASDGMKLFSELFALKG